MHRIDTHRRPQSRAGTVGVTPTLTRWSLADRAAGWTLLAMTLTAFAVFALG